MMAWFLRIYGVLLLFVGLFLVGVAIDARLESTGEPYPPWWIVSVAILGFTIFLGGIFFLTVKADDD